MDENHADGRPAAVGWLNPIFAVAAACAVGLTILVGTSAPRYIFDERFYIAGAKLLASGASFHTFLLAPLDTPAGPLYATLHWVLSPLTGLAAPQIRFVNLVLLAVIICALAQTLRLWSKDRPWRRALMFFAVPTVWVTAGMALTEIPAVTAITLSVLCIAWAMAAAPEATVRIWSAFAGAGILFGIGVLGRQPFLPAVIGFVAIAVVVPRLRWPATLATACALAVPAPVFIVWGGLVPPDTAFVGAGINLEYGALGFAYTAVFVLLLAPRYLVTQWKLTVLASTVAAIIAMAMGGLSIQVAAGMARHLPATLAWLFQLAASGLLVASGVAFVLSSAINAWQRRDDYLFVLLVGLSVGLAATPAMVAHQFSSRYLMMTFPFLLLAVQPFTKPGGWAAARLTVGGLLGAISLRAFLAY